MSIKLHNGFVFKSNDIREIRDTIDEFRKKLEPLVHNKTVQYFAEECSMLFDLNTINNKKNTNILSTIYQQFSQKQDEIRVKRTRDPSVDFQFNIVVIPSEDKFYGLFYTEQKDFADLWSQNKLVSEYIYYNNADEPEGISVEEWKERSDVWDSLLDEHNYVPSIAGFTFEVIQEITFDIPKTTEVVDAISSIKDRASVRARDNMFKRFCENKKFTDNNVMKIYREFVDFMTTDEGEKKYDDEIGRMMSQLKLTITERDLV